MNTGIGKLVSGTMVTNTAGERVSSVVPPPAPPPPSLTGDSSTISLPLPAVPAAPPPAPAPVPQPPAASAPQPPPASATQPPVLLMEAPTTSLAALVVEPVPQRLTAYRPAVNLADIKLADVRAVSAGLIQNDLQQVLGATPQVMADRFQIDPHEAGLAPRLRDAHTLSRPLLDNLADKILDQTEGGQFHLQPGRISIHRTEDATAQHTGYLAGVLSRLPGLKQAPNQELVRILLRSYFAGDLRDTSGAQTDARSLLAEELTKAAGGAAEMREFVKSPSNDALFDAQAVTSGKSLLYNLAAHWAGETTLEFTSKLMGDNDKRASAFLKTLFRRPDADLQQLMRDPHGLEGLVLHFAATAHHEAWECARLGSAQVAAAQGDARAIDQWNHKDIGPTRRLIVEDSGSSHKVADQIQSFMLRQNMLVPCNREGEVGATPLSRLLESIERNGIYADDSKLRVLSPYAARVQEQLHDDVKQAAGLSDWKVGSELAADVVANTCAAFASHAVKADFEQREGLTALYRNAIGKFAPQVDRLLAKGIPNARDDSYQALYQEMAGEFGFEALKEHMGTGAAHDLVRQATLGDIIPIACEALRLPRSDDYTPDNIVKDIEGLKTTLLKDDYFLSQPSFSADLHRETQRLSGSVDPKDLQNGIRIPNAVWMWTQLLRGLVEKKPGRYSAERADLSSDRFPSGVQLNPPDIRDVELFTWARHRLEAHGQPPKDATRGALALIVLTQYKDLLQLRQAA